MRRVLVVLHRWFGLAIAAFLLVSGATGAIIAWDHELDEWLNPAFYRTDWRGAAPSMLERIEAFEAQHPDLVVTFSSLYAEPGHVLMLAVEPRDLAQQGPGFNQVALHPISGEILARRQWGAISLARENLLPFLYKLHYSWHLPEHDGIEFGVLLLGIVAMVWVIDCVVALSISFPSWRAWRKSFAFRRRRLTFDLHRSGGVWLWLLLLTLAVTSVSMNLGEQVMRPLVALVTEVGPSPFAQAPPPGRDGEPVARGPVIAQAQMRAAQHGITLPLGGIFYSREFKVYGVGFYSPENSHGDGTLGNPWLYFDAVSGEFIAAQVPGTGSAGDIFLQAQFPLHSGRLGGIAGRVLVSLLGVAVAVLSVTGVIIWARKRRARGAARTSGAGAAPSQPVAFAAGVRSESM